MGDNNTIEIIEVSVLPGSSIQKLITDSLPQINKFMALVHLASLLYKSQKMNHLSPSLTILELQPKHEASAVVVVQSSVGGEGEAATNVAEEAHFSVSAAAAVSKATTTTTVEGEEAVAVDLGGKIMTNPNATEILQSTSSLTGRCWRKLTSIAWQS